MSTIIESDIREVNTKAYFAKEEDAVRVSSKRFLRLLLILGGLGLLLSCLFYVMSYYSSDYTIYARLFWYAAAGAICYFGLKYFDSVRQLEQLEKGLIIFYDKYKGVDAIQYEYDEEGIRQFSHGALLQELKWKAVLTYYIGDSGIYLYNDLLEDKIRIIRAFSSEEVFKMLEEFVRRKMDEHQIPPYSDTYHPNAYKKKFKQLWSYLITPPVPLISVVFFVLCTIIWLASLSLSKEPTWEEYNTIGYYSYSAILEGKTIGLLSCNFVHIQFLHFIFNVYWLIILGSKIEKEIRGGLYLILSITAALVCSLLQLLFSDEMGIGFSGVIYAYFGFILVGEYCSDQFNSFLRRGEIYYFILWLFICVVLTYTNILNVANTAHFAGFIWGILAGLFYFNKKRKLVVAAMFFITGLSVLSIVWNPMSVQWLSHHAYEEHVKNNYEKAIYYYDRILEKEPGNEWAKENRSILKGAN